MHTTERLYYSDSFLKTFTATVTDVQQTANGGGYRVALNRSAFYPTSGGQPFDTGQMIADSHDGAALTVPVERVEEDEEGTVWHFVNKPLTVGMHIEGHIDWERRFDHMQQHTGQHLLSAVYWQELQAPTISFHLGESSSTIDLAGGQLAQKSIEDVERIANEIIGEDRAVRPRFVSPNDAESLLAAGKIRKLPDRQGAIRLIEIADCDDNACGGTHVRSTGQIGALLLRSMEKVSRGIRIEFVCGKRAVRTARADLSILRESSAMLSTGSAELPASVARILAEAKTSAKERQRLREELATFQGEKLANEAPIENGVRLVTHSWSDRDRDYVKLLASKTAAAAPRTVATFSSIEADSVHVFIARSSDLDFHCGQVLREALSQFGLRGGGSPDLAQGQVPAEHEPSLQASLSDSIRKSAIRVSETSNG